MTPITDAFTQGGQHENRIRAIFPNNFVWEGNCPIFSKPLYILAFANRSGSNLLADYLRQTRKFRGFGESLNWDQIQRSIERSRVASFPDYIAQLVGPPDEPGLWGVKASWEQIVMLQRANIFSMFSGVEVIHSVRHDILGQAVSHWIAFQNNQWTSSHKETGIVPKFSLGRIEQIIMDIVRSNAYIEQIARALDVSRHVVVYEHLQNDPAAEVRTLGKSLSINLNDWQPELPRISKQRGEVNDCFSQMCLEAWRAAIM